MFTACTCLCNGGKCCGSFADDGEKTPSAEDFSDLDSARYYYDGVAYCVKNGLKNGLKFEDVPEACYYRSAVEWAVSHGILTGVTETEFAPEMAITREMMCTLTYGVGEETTVSFEFDRATDSIMGESAVMPLNEFFGGDNDIVTY